MFDCIFWVGNIFCKTFRLEETIEAVGSHQLLLLLLQLSTKSIKLLLVSRCITLIILLKMSKSECEAVALYQKVFSYCRMYKYRYDWDVKKGIIVKVESGSKINEFVHRFHIPVAINLFAIILMTYGSLHHTWAPTKQIEIPFIAELLQFVVVGLLLVETYFYWLFFMAFPQELICGMNRLLVHNRNISKT